MEKPCTSNLRGTPLDIYILSPMNNVANWATSFWEALFSQSLSIWCVIDPSWVNVMSFSVVCQLTCWYILILRSPKFCENNVETIILCLPKGYITRAYYIKESCNGLFSIVLREVYAHTSYPCLSTCCLQVYASSYPLFVGSAKLYISCGILIVGMN